MTVLAGMTVVMVIVFFLVIILGLQIQISSLIKRLDELARKLDDATR